MGSIPDGQFFSLYHARVTLIISLFTLPKLFITILKLFTILGLGFDKLSQTRRFRKRNWVAFVKVNISELEKGNGELYICCMET